MKNVILGIFLLLLSLNAQSASYYQVGKIKNITAVTGGIMIMMDTGLPDNCAGTPFGWLLIKQEYAAITSVVLAAWASGNKSGVVYTSGRENGTGYCLVNQFDPEN